MDRRSSLQDMTKGREVYGFREKHVEASVASAFLISRSKISANRDGRQSRPALTCLGHQFVAVSVGQPNIAHHNVHLALVQKFQSGLGGIARRNLVTPASEDGGESLPGIVVVLDQEDGAEGMKTSRHF
jgi:hypothetical protein